MWPRAVRNTSARPGRTLCALAAPGHGQRHLKVRGTSKDLERWTGGARRQPGPGPRGTWLGLWTLFHVFTLQIYSNWSSECAAAHAASAFKAGRKPDCPPDPRLGARPTKRQTEPGRHPPSPAFCVTAVGGSRPGPTPPPAFCLLRRQREAESAVDGGRRPVNLALPRAAPKRHSPVRSWPAPGSRRR